MNNRQSTYRDDEQLWSILDETGDWAISDAHGSIVCHLASLRDALARAQMQIESGGVVRAVSRLAPNAIIVFSAQIDRLVALIEDQKDALAQKLRATGN